MFVADLLFLFVYGAGVAGDIGRGHWDGGDLCAWAAARVAIQDHAADHEQLTASVAACAWRADGGQFQRHAASGCARASACTDICVKFVCGRACASGPGMAI